jgi:hypothetical protein
MSGWPGGVLLADPAFEHLAGAADRGRFRLRRMDSGERRLTQRGMPSCQVYVSPAVG